MTANEHQVGGTHYKTEYEHWDLVINTSMGYLEGNTTKYVSRARKKNGVQDYKKAMHYLDKLIECFDNLYDIRRRIDIEQTHREVNKFALANNLTLAEEEYIVILCTYHTKKDLHAVKQLLEDIIIEASIQTGPVEEEPNYPGTPADGGHHACNQ